MVHWLGYLKNVKAVMICQFLLKIKFFVVKNIYKNFFFKIFVSFFFKKKKKKTIFLLELAV